MSKSDSSKLYANDKKKCIYFELNILKYLVNVKVFRRLLVLILIFFKVWYLCSDHTPCSETKI